MTRPILFAHPFSSYCQKVLIALYESGTGFDYRLLGPEHPENGAELARRWPIGKFPILVDRDRTIVEASAIIEHLAVHHPGETPLIPAEAAAAVETRMLDRIFDNYAMTPMQKIVGDVLRDASDRDPTGVAEARATLGKAYAWLDRHLADREWAAGPFGLADCAAAPALFYADWVEPIASDFTHLRAYRARLLARPSIICVVDEARPYRGFFPPGAPDRD